MSTPRACSASSSAKSTSRSIDDAVADHRRDAGGQDAGGQQVQRVLLVADDDRVAGVVAAVELDDDSRCAHRAGRSPCPCPHRPIGLRRSRWRAYSLLGKDPTVHPILSRPPGRPRGLTTARRAAFRRPEPPLVWAHDSHPRLGPDLVDPAAGHRRCHRRGDRRPARAFGLARDGEGQRRRNDRRELLQLLHDPLECGIRRRPRLGGHLVLHARCRARSRSRAGSRSPWRLSRRT